MRELSTAVTVTATGTVISGQCEVTSLGLTGDADAARVTFRDGGVQGPVRWSLAAVAQNESSGISFPDGLRFTNSCHVTVDTGTTPLIHVAVRNPQANQLNPS